MGQVSIEAPREAAPYLNLIRQVLPPEAGLPDGNGFIAVGRRVFQESLARTTQSLSATNRFPGDAELLALVGQAASLREVKGLYTSWGPGADRVREGLELSVAMPFRSGRAEEENPTIMLPNFHGRFKRALESGGVRLAALLTYSNTRGQLTTESAVDRNQFNVDIVEEMKELDMSYPGEQPSRLQYLIRFD